VPQRQKPARVRFAQHVEELSQRADRRIRTRTPGRKFRLVAIQPNRPQTGRGCREDLKFAPEPAVVHAIRIAQRSKIANAPSTVNEMPSKANSSARQARGMRPSRMYARIFPRIALGVADLDDQQGVAPVGATLGCAVA
jgi:hypothetical protein